MLMIKIVVYHINGILCSNMLRVANTMVLYLCRHHPGGGGVLDPKMGT